MPICLKHTDKPACNVERHRCESGQVSPNGAREGRDTMRPINQNSKLPQQTHNLPCVAIANWRLCSGHFQLNSVTEHNSLPQFASPLGSEQTNTYAATRQTEVTAESPVSLVLADLHKMPTNRQKRMAPVQGHANYRVAIIFLSVLNRGLSSAAQPSLQRNACVHS